VGLGMPVKKQGIENIQWKTPEGKFIIIGKSKNPVVCSQICSKGNGAFK